MAIQLSVVIITKNEEKNIERCLQSVVSIADDIVVLDSLSTDQTEAICQRYPVRFIKQAFLGYIEQKNKALEFSKFDYVLSLDADEALSEELQFSVKEVKMNWNADGYFLNRRTNYCGHWIKHCGWYPDRKLRLFNKQKGIWAGVNPHDKYTMQQGSTIQYLKGDVLHYSYYTIDQHIDQIKSFSTIAAREMHKNGKRPSAISILISPAWKFIRCYIIKRGFLDGYYGLVVCLMAAYATFFKYFKARELAKQ
jgi:glycosyltransferase involved in cell wall biosynthesis